MLTYRIRPRVFQFTGDGTLHVPAAAEARFHLQSLQPFGMSAGGGRTIVKGAAAQVLYIANTGQHEIISAAPPEAT